MEVSGQLHVPVALLAGKEPSVLIGYGLDGPQGRSEQLGSKHFLFISSFGVEFYDTVGVLFRAKF
jgi:hypothetical protein